MSARFVQQGDYIILDKETGLLWQAKASEDPMVWKDGVAFVESLNKDKFGGCSDWRLPSQEELGTLLLKEEDRATGLFLDAVFGTHRCFWTGTESEHHHRAVYCDFYYGDLYKVEEMYANFYIRAVRKAA